jgi:hypothetical protein
LRFDREPKIEGYRWTPRMESLHLRRQERAAEKIAVRYPLFSDQIEVPQALSIDAEKERRERLLFQSEQRMRDLYARQWRDCRREYFACSSDVRSAITAEWNRWRGPAKPGNFSYVMEKHTGVGEEKSRRHREREGAMLARILAAGAVQTTFL